MSNHIHVIWTARENNLSDIIRDFKTFTSKAISASVQDEPESRRDWLLHMFSFYANRTNANESYKVWTGNNHAEEIYSDSFLRTKLNYIHENPIQPKWKLCTYAEEYRWSSAAFYYRGDRSFGFLTHCDGE